MAINKNFVIKNGVEVNTNLLVGDSTLNKVGIATTVPGYTLHIGVGGGARGGIGATDITVTGIATIGVANSTSGALSVTGISTFDGLIDANGGVSARTAAVQDLTSGRVVLAGTGGELEDNTNLTYDGTTLASAINIGVGAGITLQRHGGASISGITTIGGALDANSTSDFGGTVTVSSGNIVVSSGDVTLGTGVTLQGNGNAAFAGIVTVGGNLNVTGDYSVDEISARNLTLTGIATVGTGVTLQPHGGVSIAGITTINGNLLVGGDILPNADGAKDLGAVGSEFQDLFIDGTANIDALVADSAKVSDLTAERVVIAGTSGELEDNSNLTFDGTQLATHTLVASSSINAGSGATMTANGNLAIAGFSTFNNAVNIQADATLTKNVTISGVTTTGENLGGFKRLVGAASSTVVSIAVTVAAKTTDHRYYGQGSGNGYWLDGVESPFVTLVPGKLYFFDQSNSTNSGHPLLFYLEQDKANAYTTEVVTVGTPGSSGAYTKIGIGTGTNENNHPAVLHYQCSAHGLMGNAVATQSNSVNLPDSSAATIRANLTVNGDIDLSGSIDVDGTANIDVLDVDEGGNIAGGLAVTGGLVANSAKVSDLTTDRVVVVGSSGELEDDSNFTFDGALLKVGLAASISAIGNAQFQGITTIGTSLDVNGTSNFGGDVVFDGDAANITFDKSTDDLKFDNNAKAVFGANGDLEIFANGSDTLIKHMDAATGSDLLIQSDTKVIFSSVGGAENHAIFNDDGAVELFNNGVKIFQTTGIGITVGLSSVQHNGNAAFAGITTIGTLLDANGRIDGASGANFSGIVTTAASYITKLAQSNGDSGSVNEVPVANGSGGWNWAPVNTAGASDIRGITVREEGSNVGTAGSITTLDFVGNDVTATAFVNSSVGIATITIDSNIAGINTLTQSYFHDQHIVGVVSFIASDQEAVFNVGTAATIYKNGNIRTTGITSIRGGLVVGDTTDKITNGGLLVATSAGVGVGTIKNDNGNAAFAGIVTAGRGFNIGIQSAGIVIAKNVGISTLNFVGSGNSVTYFAATNTLDVSIAGSSGGGGGVSETSTSVSSTSATSCGSFAKASKRSASVLAQITQGSAYQVGRYLVIHDGTTTTTVEESAVATGSMLGTFEGVINGDDVEFRVTMSSSSSATVITKIDSISV